MFMQIIIMYKCIKTGLNFVKLDSCLFTFIDVVSNNWPIIYP